MTVTATSRRSSTYAGNASATVFPFSFKVFDKTDIKAIMTTAVGGQSTLAQDSDYSVAVNADQKVSPGGSITYPISGSPLPVGASLFILGASPYSQTLSLPAGGNFNPITLEAQLDRTEFQIQQLKVMIDATVRGAEGDVLPALPAISSRASRVLAFDSSGNPITIPGVDSSSAAALALDLASTAVGKGTSLIGWLRAMTGAVAATVKDWIGWQEVNLFEFLTVAQIADYQAGTLTLDLTTPVQAWLTAAAGQVAVLPRGYAKITSAVTVPAGTTVRGRGSASRVYAYGCDGVIVGGDYVNLENFAVYSRSAVGVDDPKLYKGVYANGTGGAHINYLNVSNVLCRGWQSAVYLAYTWSSLVDDVTTINTSYGLVWFGQSVNNVVSNCQLVCELACVLTIKDTGIRGEGLMIADSLLSSANSAVQSDGFLVIGVYNCVVDLIGGTAFDFTGVESFVIDCPWVYATNRCVNLAALGSPTDIGGSIRIGRATTTSADSLIVIGANNKGVNIFGSQLKKAAGGGYPILLNGAEASVWCNNIENLAATEDIYVNAADCAVFGNTGDKDVGWAVSPVLTVASVAGAMTLPPSQSDTFIVSGNLAITSIPVAGWDGRRVTLVSTGGTWTLTDGSNLKLAGNFVATADDAITIACVGANWYEVARSVN